MDGPLSGTRVLAISQFIAGPFGSMLLGDMGAEVIKVEPPEPVANRALFGPGCNGESFYHLAFNRSKKSITLNLWTEAGRQAFCELVSVSDVVWSNLRPQAIKNIGADYATVSRINPRIIGCYVTGYGLSGPYRDRPSFDICGLAMSGVMSVTGVPGGPPLKPGAPIGDIMAGTLSAMGVCAALHQRERTGQGQLVDTSLLDSCMATLVYEFAYYFCCGIVPGPLGSGHLALVPYNAYHTKEGWMVVGPSWPRLARVLGLDWMIDDSRFSTPQARLQNREELDRIIQEKLMEATAQDWLGLMYIEDVAAAPVNTLDKTAADPQVKHRNMVLELDHPLGGKVKLVGNPVKMPGSIDDSSYSPPPTLGQHNDEVLGGVLGYSREKIDRVLEEGKAHIDELREHLYKRL
ncbi:MAG: CoA transferase [Chloroflexi bacterium]|nr:CoA transferase [Chloroflexota bacterium]